MTFPLELQFMPEYHSNLASRLGEDDIELFSQVNECKTFCMSMSKRFNATLEESSLCWFQTMLPVRTLKPNLDNVVVPSNKLLRNKASFVNI